MHVAYLLRRTLVLLTALCVLFLSAGAFAQGVEPRPKKKGRKYSVRIDSAPQQAAIFLDDEKYGIVGYTPWDGRLEKGDWKVILKKDGYELATRTVRVKRSRTAQETFVPMVKKDEPALLDIRADGDAKAFGAEVLVDGQLQGTVPVLIKVKEGRHLVEIKKPEHSPFTQWIDAQEGQRVTVNPVLKKNAVGSILIEADVPGAEVYLDGNKHPDATPTMIRDIAAGPHVVEVRKEPALPWRQTVEVKANQTLKVSAQLQATIGGPSGTIRVLSGTPQARVFLDGTEVGVAPIDIKDVKVGEHVIEVKAEGFQTKEERLAVGAGSATVIKMDLTKSPDGAVGVISVVSPIPEAEVFIDGAKLGSVPQTKEVPAGEHFVVVSKPGFKDFEKKVVVVAGKELPITAKLKAVGIIRLLSDPSGATVLIDGQEVGRTPMVKENVEAGLHVVQLQLTGHYEGRQEVEVKGGATVLVNPTLELIDTGPTQVELQREQRGQTSFGARTLNREKVNIDVGAGYPYFVDIAFTVGAGKLAGQFGFDAGLTVRSFGSRTDLGAKARLNLVSHNPFAFGVFTEIGGGANFVDETRRNAFFFKAGAIGSLAGLGRVTITGRTYVDFWSDRHCPEVQAGNTFDGSPLALCTNYLDRSNGGNPSGLSQENFDRVNDLLDGDDIFTRDNGLRLMTSLIVEVAVRQNWNVWFLFEGAPFQRERAVFTDLFSAPMTEKDIGTYFRVGGTYKF